MRPPEFTGGNAVLKRRAVGKPRNRFNEAAGIHRRKPVEVGPPVPVLPDASMRPPEFTGGNVHTSMREGVRGSPRFNEAAGIHRRKLGLPVIAAPDLLAPLQ